MKRSITLLVLMSVLLGACVPLSSLPTATVPPAVTTAGPEGAATPSGLDTTGPQSTATSAPPPPATIVSLPQVASTPTLESLTTAVPSATLLSPTAAPAAPAPVTATPVVAAAAPTTATLAAPITATVTVTTTAHQWKPDEQLPVDPQVHQGKLANGLTYVVRKNAQPQDRAELRLVVNAGSVLEDDDQKGLAHFLEHMLFNGTCRFPKQTIQNFLETNGMRFGADLNASTSADETVYVLRIPLDNAQVMDTALNVLVDWASCATLDPTEMDRERGVILDEYRLRELNAQGRIGDKLTTALLAGSKYEQRLPIGDMSIVQNASVDTLRRFYTTWYRPDLMGVIAVGDFDPSQIEQLIRQKFAAIPARNDAPARPAFDVPGFSGTHYLVATDPENPNTYVQVYTKQPAPTFGTVAEYRKTLVQNLFYSMLSSRYVQLVQGGSAPFTSADAGPASIVRTTSANVVEAQAQEQNILPALDTLMTEIERVRRYGFTAAELDRGKSALLEQYRRAYDDRNTADTTGLVNEYVRHFLTGEDIPGIAVEYDLANQLVPQITLQDVNQDVQALTATDNRVVVTIAPEKQGFTPPTADQLAAVVDAVAKKDIQPYVAQTAATQLMAEIPQPAAVITQTTISELGVTEIKLTNGVRVVLKPTQFNADEVLFAGVARGGASLLPDADVPAARFISRVVASSGVGDFNKTQLDQLLAGKTVSVTPDIRELTQRIDGSASPRDLETAFQLINLYLTRPRLDESALKAATDAAAADLANRALAPESALQDTLTSLLYGDSIRRKSYIPLADIQAVDAKRAFQIYKDRFADASGFTFTFVGNFDPAQVTSLAQRYLGTLPATGKAAAWADRLPGPATGVHQQDVYKGTDNRSIAEIVFPGAFVDTPDNGVRLSLTGDVLNLQLTAELRQKLGASYSPSVDTAIEHWPQSRYVVALNFTADPTQVKDLLTATYTQVDALRTSGPTADDLAKAKEQEKRSHEEALRQNGYWLDTLINYGLDPEHQDPRTILQMATLIDKVTASDLQQAAQQLLNKEQYVQVVLYPTSQQPSAQQPSALQPSAGVASAQAK